LRSSTLIRSIARSARRSNGNETRADRFHLNGTAYEDPFHQCLPGHVNGTGENGGWENNSYGIQFDCLNSLGTNGGGGRSSCVVCSDEQPCLFDVLAVRQSHAPSSLPPRPLLLPYRFAAVAPTAQSQQRTPAAAIYSTGQVRSDPRASSAPLCVSLVSQDPGETKNLAKAMPALAASMRTTLDTYQPYVPVLTPSNLACYNCSFNASVMWQGYPGPGCIAKAPAGQQ
jgi:hypothetical protein